MKRKRRPRGSYGEVPTVRDTLGKRIRAIRLAWRWSQTVMAEAIHSNQKTLSHWERDRQKPSEAALGALAGIFGLSMDCLLTGEGFQIPEPPRQIGGLLVAEAYAVDLVRLPPIEGKELLLVNRTDESTRALMPHQVQEVLQKAQEENRPVWVVVG